jgi:hypothetical protein
MSTRRDEVRAWLQATCERQGIPLLVRDPLALARIGALLGGGSEDWPAQAQRADSPPKRRATAPKPA